MEEHAVICVLEALPHQGQNLKDDLLRVVGLSQNEKTNIEYRLHQSKENPCQFILYEKWTSSEDHQKQFSKPYILDLIKKTKTMLGKPYQVFLAEDISEIKALT
jgi:quinol monooxygenase YgiN